MIMMLTPFPSVKYIYSSEDYEMQHASPSKSISLNILSKGVYSAQIMKVLQEDPLFISILSGFAGKTVKHYLNKAKIKSDIVWTDRSIHGHEPYFSEKEISILNYKLNHHIKDVSTLVLSGILPIGHETSMYHKWVSTAQKYNIKVVISTGQKKVWQTLLQMKPYAVLLTEAQLKNLGYPSEDYEAIIKAMRPHLGNGLHYICIDLKNRGALILAKNKYCLVQSPVQLVNKYNTGASGAFLGALAIGINRKYEQEKIGKLCLASALVADDNILRPICNRSQIESQYKKVKIKVINPPTDH